MKAILAAVLVALTLSTALADGPICLRVFSNSDIGSHYPMRNMSRYLENNDMVNYMEVGVAETQRVANAMTFDLIKQNDVFENLAARIEASAEKTIFGSADGIEVRATKVEGRDELVLSWKREGESTSREMKFLKRTLMEEVGQEVENSVREKAYAFSQLFRGDFETINPRALTSLMKGQYKEEALQFNGREMTVHSFESQASRLRLNRLMGLLLPNKLSKNLYKAAKKVQQTGETSGSNKILRWNDLDDSASVNATAALGNIVNIKLKSQALEVKVTANKTTNEVILDGVVDKYSLEGTKAQRSFVVVLKDGEFTIVGGAAKSGIESRLLYDVMDTLNELVPNWYQN